MDTEEPIKKSTARRWYAPRRWWAIAGVVIVGATAVLTLALAKSPTIATRIARRPNNSTVANAVGSGYLADESNAAFFIQWTRSGNNLSGTAQAESLSGSAPNEVVASSTISVEGQVHGSTITLSFNNGSTVFGTLSGGSFTVNFPQSDGSLAPVTFTSASAVQFNQALSALQRAVGNANISAATAETIASEQQSIDNVAAAVEQDLAGLKAGDESLSNDVGSFANDLAQANTDLGTTVQGEKLVITESENGTNPIQVCSDSITVGSDLITVSSDGDTVSSTADSVESDVSSLRSGISGLQQDFSQLQSAQALQPSYIDGAPSQSEVSQAIATAQSEVAAAIASANAAINQVNSYETQAYNDAVAAAQSGNCAGPASPYIQPTIS